MDADQYRGAIKALGLNHTTAALFLGIAGSSSARYAKAKSPVPEQIAMLLLHGPSTDWSYSSAQDGGLAG